MSRRSMTAGFLVSAAALLSLDAALAFTESGCAKAKDAPPPPTTVRNEQGASPTPPTEAKVVPVDASASPDATPPPADAAANPDKPDDTPPPADAPCDSLSRRRCLASDHCTLELVSGNMYRCRADKGVCEAGIKQTDAKACAAKAECKFDAGGCYCQCEGAARTEKVDEPQSGCKCVCGGGKPPMCVAK